ncbi:NADP-dependent oxidoreductase [Nonomuraea rubra]|uniref:NADPH:quinone reductase-like Zn-dependent oxidoreductase n=1 Tax=Nonomuraea rubra TaxID=46180 RepID=A0A7X0U0M8_9ACTN|nr:NADP-dependent oxidoreductase [Nonomuraea rubra]MBB6550723.1 NADPH:quinone reductase-like Zn-dependent oxidoreductase [Nonomuraea rubra]
MKALVVPGYGPPGTFTVEDLPIPEPGPGQLQVRVAAASLNPADLLMTAGTVREMVPLDFPFVPGTDAAGTVTKIGPGTRGFEVGEEVFGFGAPPSFAAGVGIPAVTSGALAEYATFQAGPFLAKRPPKLSVVTAAALPSTGMTGLAVLERGRFQPGETVLVIGAPGGIGSVVVPLLAAQCVVLATGTGPDRDYVRGLGATEVIDHRGTDLIGEVRRRHPGGIDAVVNLALTGEAVIAATRTLRPGGRLLSTTPGTPAHPAVTTVMGTTDLRPGTMDTLAAHVLDGILPEPATTTHPLSDAPRALADLAQQHTRGKLVVIVDPAATR